VVRDKVFSSRCGHTELAVFLCYDVPTDVSGTGDMLFRAKTAENVVERYSIIILKIFKMNVKVTSYNDVV
jgi:hypothetical protein